MLVACAPTVWPANTPEEQILTEMARAGYIGAPAEPRGNRSADDTVRLYAQYMLFPAPGRLEGDLWRPDRRDRFIEHARWQARFARDVGCAELYVAPGGLDGYKGLRGKTRRQVAGHVTPQDGMNAAEWRVFVDTLHRAGEVTLRDGVSLCLQNQVGSVIESGEELERALAALDPALVSLGPDTGHLTWAGVDPVDFCRRHAGRIKTVRVRDVRPDVLRMGQAKGWDHDGFMNAGIFAELGQGCVDFRGLFHVLRNGDFAGWVIVETNPDQKPAALESATAALAFLKLIGAK